MIATRRRGWRDASESGMSNRERWFVLAGVLGSIGFVAAWLLAGFLRPGYSVVQQPISDLGVGPFGWLIDVLGGVAGLLKVGFALGFALVIKRVVGNGWRFTASGLLVLSGLSMLVVSTFTDAPATVRIHSMATVVGISSRLLAMVTVGVGLLATKNLRGWGVYSLLTAFLTLALGVVEFSVFNPASPLASAHIGGLAERIFVIEVESWYIALGLLLFSLSPARGGEGATAGRTPGEVT